MAGCSHMPAEVPLDRPPTRQRPGEGKQLSFRAGQPFALKSQACCPHDSLIMQDGHVESGLGLQIAELISDAGCCPHLGRFSPRNFLKRQRPQVTRPVAAKKDVQSFLQQVRAHAQMWEATMQCNASYLQVHLHLHRLSTHHLGVNMQNAAECIYTFVDRDTCQLQLAFRWARFCSHQLLAD